jgi:hypothetical protein
MRSLWQGRSFKIGVTVLNRLDGDAVTPVDDNARMAASLPVTPDRFFAGGWEAFGAHRAWRGATLAAATVLVLMPGCGTPATPPVADPARLAQARLPPPELRVVHVALEELQDHLSRYIGYTVQVTGMIAERPAPRILMLDHSAWTDPVPPIVIYGPGRLASALRVSTVVTVTGTVKVLAAGDLLDRHDPTVHEWLGQPVVVAAEIEWWWTRSARMATVRQRTDDYWAALPAATSTDTAGEPVSESASSRARDDSAYTRTSRASRSVDPSRRSTRASMTYSPGGTSSKIRTCARAAYRPSSGTVVDSR